MKISTKDLSPQMSWSYGTTAKITHWILAVLLIGLLALGWYMVSIEDQPGSRWYFNLHKSIGILAGSLILFRIIWRLAHPPGHPPRSIKPWEQAFSLLTHGLLYLGMVIMPLTGFLGSTFSKKGITFFGLKLPTLVTPNRNVAKLFFETHEIVAWLLAILIGLHILAAIKHLVINRDSVFKRMWF